MSDTFRVFRLISGEEIAATVVDQAAGVYEKVRVVQMVQTGPKTVGVGMIPYSAACVDGKVTFRPGAIAADLEHSVDIERLYIDQTTPIQIVGAGSIPT